MRWNDMKKILLVGGGFDNKGAQAMTFACVDQIKKLRKNYEPVLCLERKVSEKEKREYNFTIVEMNRLCELRGNIILWLLVFCKSTKEERQQYKNFCNILKETECVIDISGFQLSSKWPVGAVVGYLTRINFYKKRGIKVLLFPQSFGPLEFSYWIQKPIEFMIRKYLKYPEMIYAREQEGYDLLVGNYGMKNVSLSPDLVLLHNEISQDNIYHIVKKESLDLFNVKANSVCIIPNTRLKKKIKEDALIIIYERIIKTLLEKQKNIYLLRHSIEDKEICLKIKEKFSGCSEVQLLLDNISCQEYCKLVRQFDFIIASRYHSIVHAYKEGKPAIILGWAIKYVELAALFGQEKYQITLGNDTVFEDILNILDDMMENHKENGRRINEVRNKLQQQYNFYEYFKFLN